MAQMVSWPPFIDDDGSLTTGTIANAAWDAAVKASIEDQVHNVTYPTIKPKAITGEVEAIKAAKAAGSWNDLKDALDGVVDFTDGSLIVPAFIIDQDTLRAAIGGQNLVMNSTFLMWPKATQAAYWSDNAQVSRDTGDKKIGLAGLAITRSGVDVYTTNIVIESIVSLLGGYFRGKKFGFGVWAKCGAANTGVMNIYDGVNYYSLAHSGSGGWEWLSGVATFSEVATEIRIQLGAINNDLKVNFDGVTMWLVEQAPAQWIPNKTVYGSLYYAFPGALSIGDYQGGFIFARPAMVKDVQCGLGVPHDGTGAAPSGVLTIDVEKYTGTIDGWQSIFSAPKDIVSSTYFGSVQPDGAFVNRCLTGRSGNIIDNVILRLNLDAVNGAAGFWFAIRCLQYVNPLEEFLSYHDL